MHEISYLFFSLPEKYDAVTGALENLPSNELTLSVVKSRLIAEETKKNSRNDAYEDFSSAAFHNYREKQFKHTKKFRENCFRCGGESLKSNNCPKIDKWANFVFGSAGVAMMVNKVIDKNCETMCGVSSDIQIKWCLDLEASDYYDEQHEIL